MNKRVIFAVPANESDGLSCHCTDNGVLLCNYTQHITTKSLQTRCPNGRISRSVNGNDIYILHHLQRPLTSSKQEFYGSDVFFGDFLVFSVFLTNIRVKSGTDLEWFLTNDFEELSVLFQDLFL